MSQPAPNKPGQKRLVALPLGLACVSSALAVPYTLAASFTGYIYFIIAAFLIWTGLSYFSASFLIKKLKLAGFKKKKLLVLSGAIIGYLSSWLVLLALSDTSGGVIEFLTDRYRYGLYVTFSDLQTIRIGFASYEKFSGPLAALVWTLEAAVFLIVTAFNRD